MADIQTIPYRMEIPLHDYHQYQGEKTNDCGPTSLAIAANALLGEERFEKDQVAQEMNQPGFKVWPFPHFMVRRIQNWATFPWGIVHYLRQHGLKARWSPFGTPGKLLRNLEDDQITLVFVGEPWRWKDGDYDGWAHVKVLFGYQPGKGYVFIDPGCRKRTEDPKSWAVRGLFWEGEEAFLSNWRGLFRMYVDVG
ncbi:MAG: C39 family peptidase [Anaerolineales bacterium]|nr:C39 family peptidase [Anaerolineales bacterium]